jgi:polar amino acid transport system substrate-binding protein
MNLRVALSASFAIFHWATPAIAQAPKEVVWNIFDFPPYYITQGPDKGKGIYDQFLHDLTRELPGFSHRIEPSTPNRTEALIKQGESVCTVSRTQTPEREAYSIFARPPYLYILPVRIVIVESARPRVAALREDGRVSLKRLLETHTVRFGVVENRKFGHPVDSLIDHYSQEKDGPVVKWTTESLSADALKLMALGRFDGTLAYPSEFAKLQALQPQVKFVSFPLAETHHLLPAKVSCANTATGRALIAAADKLPLKRNSVRQLQLAYEALLPAEDRAPYRQLVALERSSVK